MFFGVAVLAVGLLLLATGHRDGALFCFAFGAFFVWQGTRRRRQAQSTRKEFDSAGDHAAEMTERARRGESPDQIAEAFETQYKISPILTLQYIAADRLRAIGLARDPQEKMDSLNWTGSGRLETLPTPDQVIDGLHPRRSIYAGAGDIQLHPADGAPDQPVKGGLLATRTHLFFFPQLHAESLGAETAKEFFLNFLPPVVGMANLAKGIAESVGEELDSPIKPGLIKEYHARLARPGGFAIPWREMIGVAKEHLTGLGPPRTLLVIGHGDDAAPTLQRLSRGAGFDEAWVDDWIDAVRVACLLEGRLLAI